MMRGDRLPDARLTHLRRAAHADAHASRSTRRDSTDVAQITMHFPSLRMRRLTASGLLPERAGQPVKA